MPNETTEAVRSAIEDRAMYLFFLLKEMEAVLGPEEAERLAKQAIYRYGQTKGQRMGSLDTPADFITHQMRPGRQEIFDKEAIEAGETRGEIRFHYCPLVAAWKRLGATPDELSRLCDIAMQGDHGMISHTGMTLTLPHSIARGDPYCQLILELK
jgi:predicted hydrocarbon binding protein